MNDPPRSGNAPVWRHESGGPERAADMRRGFQKLWDIAYPPVELVEEADAEQRTP